MRQPEIAGDRVIKNSTQSATADAGVCSRAVRGCRQSPSPGLGSVRSGYIGRAEIDRHTQTKGTYNLAQLQQSLAGNKGFFVIVFNLNIDDVHRSVHFPAARKQIYDVGKNERIGIEAFYGKKSLPSRTAS